VRALHECTLLTPPLNLEVILVPVVEWEPVSQNKKSDKKPTSDEEQDKPKMRRTSNEEFVVHVIDLGKSLTDGDRVLEKGPQTQYERQAWSGILKDLNDKLQVMLGLEYGKRSN